VTTGTAVFATPATQSSNVGSYPIDGSGIAAASGNYSFRFVQGPANATALRIDPATLVITVDPEYRLVGTPNPPLSGSVTGFRLADSLETATSGQLSFTTPATVMSPPGSYATTGVGLSAPNYVFVQSAINEKGLTVLPPQTTGGGVPPVVGQPRNPETEPTYLYDRNFAPVGMCMALGPLASPTGVAGIADLLEIEWSRVRMRPNLSNCLGVSDRDFCRDF
jgi:hypothetical protein